MPHKIDTTRLWLVAIRDKDLHGEPDIAFAVVEANDEEDAIKDADPMIVDLIKAGRRRCHAHVVRKFEIGRYYKTKSTLQDWSRPDDA